MKSILTNIKRRMCILFNFKNLFGLSLLIFSLSGITSVLADNYDFTVREEKFLKEFLNNRLESLEKTIGLLENKELNYKDKTSVLQKFLLEPTSGLNKNELELLRSGLNKIKLFGPEPLPNWLLKLVRPVEKLVIKLNRLTIGLVHEWANDSKFEFFATIPDFDDSFDGIKIITEHDSKILLTFFAERFSRMEQLVSSAKKSKSKINLLEFLNNFVSLTASSSPELGADDILLLLKRMKYTFYFVKSYPTWIDAVLSRAEILNKELKEFVQNSLKEL